MLLHCSPIAFPTDGLRLPPWVLAPCNLVEGAPVYVALLDRHPSGFPALLISPFEFGLWNDLWRIELELKDAPGETQRLFALLVDHGITPLAMESSAIALGDIHRKTVICSLSHYCGVLDGQTAQQRVDQRFQSLKDLRVAILNEFIREVLVPDGRSANVRVDRLSTYFEAYAILKTDPRIECHKATLTLSGQRLKLPDTLVEDICSVGKAKNFRAILTVDTTDRVIHALFPPHPGPGGNIRIFVRNDPRVITQIHKVLSRSYTILRAQMRLGAIRAKFIRGPNFCTLTLFIRHRTDKTCLTNDQTAEVVAGKIDQLTLGTRRKDWDVEVSHLFSDGVDTSVLSSPSPDAR